MKKFVINEKSKNNGASVTAKLSLRGIYKIEHFSDSPTSCESQYILRHQYELMSLLSYVTALSGCATLLVIDNYSDPFFNCFFKEIPL